MGWQDTSVPFYKDSTMWNRQFQTPNMERLAAKGMKFTNAYACPVSSPTRVSLISGVNATRHNVTNWTLRKNVSTDGDNKYFTFPDWNVNGYSPVDSIENTFYGTSLATLLQQAGYTTLFVGKAHFGAQDTPGENPLNLGFDRNIAGHAAGGPATYLGTKNFGNIGDNPSPFAIPDLEEYYGEDIYLTEALTRESVKLMDEALLGDKPFFLYMANYAVHVPFESDNRFYQKYLDLGFEDIEARYAALVEGMDKSLGDIMDYLEERGIDDNTVILFMSDNGGYSILERENTFGGVNKNSPLRGGKGSLYEGGVREPMIVYAPNITEAGSVNHSKVIIEDFYPTIVELAGGELNMVQELDSESFVDALRGESINKKRPFYWHFPNDWGVRSNECGAPASSIVLGDMKFIYFYEGGVRELYNIADDISETDNLIGKGRKYERIAKRLEGLLQRKLKAEGSSLPVPCVAK